jgi:hypothetical protein
MIKNRDIPRIDDIWIKYDGTRYKIIDVAKDVYSNKNLVICYKIPINEKYCSTCMFKFNCGQVPKNWSNVNYINHVVILSNNETERIKRYNDKYYGKIIIINNKKIKILFISQDKNNDIYDVVVMADDVLLKSYSYFNLISNHSILLKGNIFLYNA